MKNIIIEYMGETDKENYRNIAIFALLIIPLIAMIDYGITATNFIDSITEYMFVTIGFFWTPVMLIMAILDWDFEARYSPLLKLAFWTIPPLLFAYSTKDSYGQKDKENRFVDAYILMLAFMFISLLPLFILIVLYVVFTGVDPFASIRGI